jgi:RNA polymerase sigma-70 factor (ECF subfamily)
MPALAVMPGVARQTKRRVLDAETALMLRVQAEETGAFAELVEQLSGRIYARLQRLVQDRQEAEDLTQEVFLRLYRARERYQPRAKFSTWLFHITQNVARNALRSRRRRRWLHTGMLDGAGEELSERTALPGRVGDALERRELAQAVRSAVAGLVGRQRRAFEMQQYQDRSYAEIARAMALSPKAAKSLLYRARIQLRDLLAVYLRNE